MQTIIYKESLQFNIQLWRHRFYQRYTKLIIYLIREIDSVLVSIFENIICKFFKSPFDIYIIIDSQQIFL